MALAVTAALQDPHPVLAPAPAPIAPQGPAPSGQAGIDDGLLELRSRRPAPRPGFIPRERLTRRLVEARERRVVLLRAPAGYGKTSLLHDWTASDPRPCAWATLCGEDNDPATLISLVALAFEAVDPIGWEVFEALSSGRPDAHAAALRRLARALGRKQAPFVLVLDDLHELRTRAARAVVRTITQALPPGSQLALASRGGAELPTARLRAQRGSVELGLEDLAMTPSEAAALLAATGIEADPRDLATLARRSEGWPAALYLGALSLGRGSDDRFLTEYVREELLQDTSPARLGFLRRTSVLERLTAPLCDAVLQRDDSAGELDALTRANVPLETLDRGAGAFRYNARFAEVLRSELRRLEPGREASLHRRASAWLEREGDRETAVRHAVRADDLPRAARLMWRLTPEAMAQGRSEAIAVLLRQLGERRLADISLLGLVAAGSSLMAGDLYEADRWTTIAGGSPSSPSSPRHSRLEEAGLALMRAAIGRTGTRRMAANASRAHLLLEDDSPWRPLCRFFEGAALHLGADFEMARTRLEDGAHRAAVSAPLIQALCLAQLALLEADEGDLARATSLASRARAQVGRFRLDGNPAVALVVAVSCAVRARCTQIPDPMADLRLAHGLIGSLTDPSPWYDAQCRVALARAMLRARGPAAADEVLAPAGAASRFAAEAPVLAGWLREAQDQIELACRSLGAADWSLTAAELRVLHYLPSHLSFREIAERLYVSQNTVKTHARAIYRKLEVSSRGKAVDLARGAGLVDAAAGG
ncbi:MAG TPA: LuxR C-terminal-related transcriptional regulator [Thermoleophilaceae bacterium]|nr:LuxR C-terminal-related transcriptional regulator [Thermoleophilaceae bacterium]